MKVSKMMMTVGLLAAMEFSGAALAHEYVGLLGIAPTATDKFYVICAANGPGKHLFYSIKRSVGVPAVGIEGANKGIAVALPAPALSISYGGWSPQKTINGGAGAYFFTVKKSSAATGAISYAVRMFCPDTSGIDLPTDLSYSLTYLQNQ